ncbi:MAG: hypothetical protein JWM91_1662 [Rhodospirillales bacterium]|nr:hypothetical protein [Rhodospirillales bacterium]
MKFLTDFGDSAVLLPLSMVVLVWLLATRPFAMAIWWGGALLFLGGVMGGLKILFFACPPAADIMSPSGHTGFSLVIYGGLAVIIAAELRSNRRKAAVILAAVSLVVGIARSRVALEMHTTLETVVGFAIGAVALTTFSIGYLRVPVKRRQTAFLLIGVIATIAVFYGSELNPERKLHALSGLLDLQRLFCPR